jgi:molybdopterin-guanine dinucleotide biosynthesis protein A
MSTSRQPQPAIGLSGFVLAGGRSSRLGRDKALLSWKGQTLLEHMVHLLGSIADPVQVVGRAPLPDRRPGLGPLSGIATGLEASFTDANVFVAVDMPFLTKDLLRFLQSRIEASSHPLLACKIGSAFPLCLGIRRVMLPEITRRLSLRQLSVRALIEVGGAEIISESELMALGFEASIFRNINTEEDYKSAIRNMTIDH